MVEIDNLLQNMFLYENSCPISTPPTCTDTELVLYMTVDILFSNQGMFPITYIKNHKY